MASAASSYRRASCAEARVAAIVTASLGEPGDHGWFVEALADLHGMGWRLVGR